MRRDFTVRISVLLIGLLATVYAGATMVQQMNLGELTTNADKIFRGTVVRVESNDIAVGGGELTATKYVIRVVETLKGNTTSRNGKLGNVVEVVMLGELKRGVAVGDVQRFSIFRPPALEVGSEYLLFTTAPSSAGLSMTVGLGQGAFQFVQGDFVLNEAKNAGLFRDMDMQGMPQRGPILYSALAQRIRNLTGN